MKKLGFTLAEVLIALAIIGVVAAMTLPNLVNEHQKDVWANSLSVAVSDFERAMGAMIMRDGVNDLGETKAWQDIDEQDLSSSSSNADLEQFTKNLSRHIKLSFDTNCKNPDSYYGQGPFDINTKTKTSYMDNDRFFVLQSKKGFAYICYIEVTAGDERYDKSESEVLAFNTNLAKGAMFVYIDVNGNKKPNTIGRDIFSFELSRDGKLYPEGSRDVSVYYYNNINNIWNGTEKLQCNNDKITDGGRGCTARLIENGYKMDY